MRAVFFWLLPAIAFAEPIALPGTQTLKEEQDRSARMVEGIARWLERETERAATERVRQWSDAAAGPGWKSFADWKRERLRAILGLVDVRTPTALEELPESDAATLPRGADRGFSVRHVRWPVFDGVHGEGLLLVPERPARATVIVVPDADQPPEQAFFAQQLARQDCLVLVPVLVDRRDMWSGNEALGRFTNQPHREWIYRQAFEVGRTLIGYEVQKILAAVDALAEQSLVDMPEGRLGLVGYGEGGLLALHAAALDTRFDVTLVSGYFGSRARLFEEPIYRNVFGLLREFGDAQLAMLIAPRALIVERSFPPQIAGPPPPREGRQGAAPGAISIPHKPAQPEMGGLWQLRIALGGRDWIYRISGAIGEAVPPGSSIVFYDAFLGSLGFREDQTRIKEKPGPIPAAPSFIDERQHRTVRELERFTQSLVSACERERTANFWPNLKLGAKVGVPLWETRRRLWEDVIGKISDPLLPPNPRSRVVREAEKWVAHEVVLDVLPEVFAWGWLLLPRDLKPGERRPVVVCQHGLEGLPEDVVNDDPKSQAFAAYKAFGARLAERGFIVYAPHNPYRGGDKFRLLQRRANPIGLSLFSFIIAQHDATTQWLGSLPFVDPGRVAFYGLSYGGKTAMRVPAVLERYCLSICSADFNEWVRKNVLTDVPWSYMFTGEWEMPEWNLARVANYAEMAMLIAPRPFMVERGRHDAVAVDEWVAYEYAKVERGYEKLGPGDRTEIEWFDGPHTINGVGTFHFLHKHLFWPEPTANPDQP